MPSQSSQPGPVIISRYTKGGRRLWYHLECIQQPERARACGSGPKSSADRRPVDPPPVVELKIFDGPEFEQAKHNDVTFHYNADMFLFATLEHARVIAHGRVQTATANTPPVLTGMPVSGMAYLDRPEEAGYFIFPDLSVRHEGRYRLTFTLYERPKLPEDANRDQGDGKSDGDESFEMRMELKSHEFTVFSAKKFPGLTESTTLSRTVAEQGCRVRIRRDVRMRRRDPKAGADLPEDDYARRRKTATPDPQRDFRARSMSSDNIQRTPYAAEPQRQPSGVEYPRPPPTFTGVASGGGHLAFGSQNHTHYPAQPYPREPASQSSSVPPSPSYPPSQNGSYPPPSPYAPPQRSSNYAERPPSQHYPHPPQPSPQRESYPYDCTRPTSSSYSLPSQSFPIENKFAAEARPYHRPIEPKISLPSLNSFIQPELSEPNTPTSDRLPALASAPSHPGKRSHDEVFYVGGGYGRRQPYKNGSRPMDILEDSEHMGGMTWRSADGKWKQLLGKP